MIKEYPVGTIFSSAEIKEISRVLSSGDPLTRGIDVEKFEKEFSKYCGAKYAIAVSSCGAALSISSKILHLKEGDEVICQANSFWVTINHLIERRVKIIPADIDKNSLNINHQKIQELISPKTKAIYLVHHGGNPADLNAIKTIARKNNVVVVEDCAHAVGAEYKGKKIGNDSELACFSFSSMKNISTLGEGGMIVTNNKTYAELARGYRTNFPTGKKIKRNVNSLGMYPKPKSEAFMHMGDAWDYDWIELEEMGSTYRMSTVQAAVGRVQLKKLDKLIVKRSLIAKRYSNVINECEHLHGVDIIPTCKHAWHLFSFFVNPKKINRNNLVKILEEKYGICITIRFFPINLGGLIRMNENIFGEKLDSALTAECENIWFNQQMSLPISPQMSNKEVDYICQSLIMAVMEAKC